jgi:hypothetical protein
MQLCFIVGLLILSASAWSPFYVEDSDMIPHEGIERVRTFEFQQLLLPFTFEILMQQVKVDFPLVSREVCGCD